MRTIALTIAGIVLLKASVDLGVPVLGAGSASSPHCATTLLEGNARRTSPLAVYFSTIPDSILAEHGLPSRPTTIVVATNDSVCAAVIAAHNSHFTGEPDIIVEDSAFVVHVGPSLVLQRAHEAASSEWQSFVYDSTLTYRTVVEGMD